MKTTLRDLLHAINVLGDDRDVLVDGIDAIAVCPPVKITPAGLEYFKKALNAAVEVEYKNDEHRATYVSNSDEEIDAAAWGLLTSLAGYCADIYFKKWFEGADAQII